jgi:hypothetical protein
MDSPSETPVTAINKKRTGIPAIPFKFPFDAPHHHRMYAYPASCEILLHRDGKPLATFWFACPGCGMVGGITIGLEEKPDLPPSWLLTPQSTKSDITTWTLTPSIHCIGCCGWHGYLREGKFVSC